jgi:hypothetical protein
MEARQTAMRMSLRLAFWLIAGITCVSLLFAVYQVEVEYQGRSEIRIGEPTAVVQTGTGGA